MKSFTVMVSGLDIARWYGSKEGLVVAMALLGLPGVRVKRGVRRVDCTRILLIGHEVVRANGA